MASTNTIPATLTDQVSQNKELEISYRILHPDAIIIDHYSSRNIRIPFSSITNKYRDFLSEIVIDKTLTDEDERNYLFKPKSLSYDVYGTTEFWNDMLILNNVYSIANFKPTKTVKIYDPTEFKKYLNEIMILEDI